MEDKPISIRSVGIKFGLITAALLIGYFLLMNAIGLIENTEFRFVNYILVALGIFLALNNLRKRLHHDRINYLPGLFTGFWVSIVGGVVFGLFVWLYAGRLDGGFIERIRDDLPFSDYMTPSILAYSSSGEVIIFGVIASLVLMQFYKRNLAVNDESFEKAEEAGAYQKNARH